MCYMPESIVQEHAIFERKPISLVNTFTQEYELTSEEVHVSHEEYEIHTESVKVETPVVLDPPEMKKSSTIEHDDINFDDDTDTLSVVSDSVDLSDAGEFPGLQYEDESDSGYEIEQQSPFMTKHLPTYETKVAMTVRSDCTKDAPVIFTLQRKARVYLLESGIAKFPTKRLSYWWRQTFGRNLQFAADYIRMNNITGEQLAAFEADTRLKLGLESDEYDTVRKALKLVKRKSQVVFFDENGVPQRGWISKVKKGKQTISRIFNKCTPKLEVRKIHTNTMEIADCEEEMERILQENALDYDAIKFGTWFDEFRHGNEFILNSKGRRRHGKWRPDNHCLIEFQSYMDAAVALDRLSNSSDLRNCEVDFAREYANLTEVTFPRY